MSSNRAALQIQSDDNVVVVLDSVSKGDVVSFQNGELTALEGVPQGHKIAIVDIARNENVVKYGYPIGHAGDTIRAGQWVHSHNLATNLSGKNEYQYKKAKPIVSGHSHGEYPQDFEGYVRENGEIGIRNEIWVLNTVGCVNKTSEMLARMANERFAGAGIDGVFHFPHPYGCSQLGDDLRYTQKALAGLVRHPNAAGVLLIGLGCENNQLEEFRRFIGPTSQKRIKYLSLQSVSDEIEVGMQLLSELADHAKTFERTRVPVSKLKVGLKCGGSDGFSGITANPLVGAVSDRLIQAGATTLLTEVPEMFGAETILMNRARDESVFQDVVSLINDFKDYYTRHNQVIYENPSPGNKDGGITTLEEKSLGCTQKGGTSEVTGVLQYGQPALCSGLQLVQAPGNDMVSVTALVAAGAHIVLFTTGRGTPMGGPVPTLKISSNTGLFQKKSNWVDFNAGRLLEGTELDDLCTELFRAVLDVASGDKLTRNEENGFREIAIFKDGVTL